MNPRFRTAALISSLATLALAIAPAALANGHHNRCSNRSVAGTFGYVSTGTRIGATSAFPVAGAGTITFDEDGTVAGQQTVSFGGTIATETYAGTWTVGEDCHGSFEVVVTSSVAAFNRTSHVSVIWEDDTNAAQAIFTDPGTIITVESRRLFSHGD